MENTRRHYIAGEIRAWCVRNNTNVSQLAREKGVHQSTMSNFVHGLTNNPELKKFIVKKMKMDVWKKYPEQKYIPPDFAA